MEKTGKTGRKALTRRAMLQGGVAAGGLAVAGMAGPDAWAQRSGRAGAWSSAQKRVPLPRVSAEADALLDDMTARNCRFFWDHGDTQTGQVLDRAPLEGTASRVASIAATGFGLSALCIAAQRGILPAADCEERVEKTLAFLLKTENVHGFYYHFIDNQTGERQWKCELSSIDTALLLGGVLTVRQYFASAKIRQMATTIYERVEWDWMMNGGPTLTMGWKPESGFLDARWNMFAELFTMYLMAIGSPTHPAPKSSWDAINRQRMSFGGIDYRSVRAPIFIHQYPHAWVDYRGQRDAYVDYFANSIAATRVHQLFCLTLGGKYPWFNQDVWGITASDGRKGYMVWGGPPEFGGVDGTVVPSAAAGSLVFLPAECSHVLLSIREKYPKAYTKYGFVDAFQPDAKWYAPDILGIDQGISVLMAENLRTGFVWEQFMKNPEIGRAMREVGFRADASC